MMRTGVAAAIINHLGGSLHTGTCRCPLHDDNDPSLSVSNGRKVFVVMKCHAGCSQEDLIAWAKAKGLWPTPDKGKDKMKTDWKSERQRQREAEEEDAARFHRAFRILRMAAQENKSPDVYLNSRGINVVPENAMLMSAKAAGRFGLSRFPTMVFPVVKDGKLAGAQVTPLSRDMTHRIKGKEADLRSGQGRIRAAWFH